MATPRDNLARKKDIWTIRLNQADVAYKVLILIVGSLVAAAFLVLQNRQTESHYYADLAAQRERADTDLRAEMFKVLFDAYFKNRIQPEQGTGGNTKSSAGRRQGITGSTRQLDAFRQETMLADMLARNFDSVDVRPLLEDLDARLAQQIGSVGETLQRPSVPQRQAFLQRQQLRRVAIGATSRQIAALEGLAGDAKARVTYHGVDLCAADKDIPNKLASHDLTSLVTPEIPPEVPAEIGPIALTHLADGTLDLRIFPISRSDVSSRTDLGGNEIKLSISFFDMPALENLRLKSGGRVAFSLYKYLSSRDCRLFRDSLDDALQEDCEYVLQSHVPDCAMVQFRTVILDKSFLGIHDRPYVNDLVAGKYREPWWKIW